jgi:type 2 lantibiotic biosynthesis protein LanM
MSLYLAEGLSYYHATTLPERLSAEPPAHPPAPLREDDVARYRRQAWKAQPPFDEPAWWAQRLALDALSEAQLRHLLAEPVEALQARFPQTPTWLDDLCRALQQSWTTDFQHLLTDKQKRNPAMGFLAVAAPFIAQSLARFAEQVAALGTNHSPLPFDPTTIQSLFFPHLAQALLDLMSRTMALELNIARLSGELTGATPQARFQSFIAQLRQPDRVRALLREYPVLARLLSEQAARWCVVSIEFLTRLCRDWADIKATFTSDDPGALVAVKGGLTDTQRGGRTIFIAQFSSGFRLVYKPKPLAVDRHFQELLQWLNARGAEPCFPRLTVLDRADYGWIEFVPARACETREEVQRFYRRQGGYLALLYLIDATDFHSANLIACGEHPYLIDLEALFHPHRSQGAEVGALSGDQQARRALADSTLQIGLLPKRSAGNSEHLGFDRSGLGTLEGQMTPYAVPRWADAGQDTMHLVRERVTIATQKNRPHLAGVPINVLDFQEEILQGFAATYALLQTHHNELLSSNGPLARFAEDEVCVFLRSSRTYRHLLSESYHPDVLRNALDRDRLFDLLWIEVTDDAALSQVIQAERAELQVGDTPLFTARPTSRDLFSHTGLRLLDFFAEASLTSVRRRIEQLSPADCARQSWFIRASLATLLTEQQGSGGGGQVSGITASREQLLAAARTIGDRLEELAFRGAEDASWVGMVRERKGNWSIIWFGQDLDAGLPGVALFLAQLGAHTGEQRYTALAEAALTALQRQYTEWGDEVTMIGAFDSLGGMIYTFTQLGVLWQRVELLAAAEAIVERLPELIAEDDELNVHSGAAGCILALHGLAQVAPSERVKAIALQCGEHLLARGGAVTASGFVQGAAGLAWALATLHDWTGEERFRAAALDALRQAQGGADETTPDWAGLGLAQLSLLRFADNAELRADLTRTIEQMLQHQWGQNHSLFLGDASHLEFLLQLHRCGETTDTHMQAQAAAWLASSAERGWRCGTPLAVETPGLLAGLAGIGYELLRVAEPELVPSVLTLEPPARRLEGERKSRYD